MSKISRRSWLEATAGSVAALSAASYGRAAGANERLRLAAIGVGGRGRSLLKDWKSVPNVEVVSVCDVDENQIAEALKIDNSLKSFSDLRAVLDDQSIDAVSIATPDHWHAPAALLALEAGKHVYLEKPCAHNFREGQALVRAARKTKLHVQHGTQARSNPFVQAAVQMLHDGVIGDVLVCKVWNVQHRGSIGRAKPSSPPRGVDYDNWLGPAPAVPFQANRFHGRWRWWYHFGTGDMGNDGVHDLDVGRWGLGVTQLPSRIASFGGKYFYDDDQEFPDTQAAIFEFPGDGSVGHRRQLVFEMRLWTKNSPFNADNGCEFHGTKGSMMLSYGGKIQVFDQQKQRFPAERLPMIPDLSALAKPNVATSGQQQQPRNLHSLSTLIHMRNFVAAVREGKSLNADIEIGFQSSALSHLGTAAARAGRSLNFDSTTAQVSDDREANNLLGREYQPNHWATPKGLA